MLRSTDLIALPAVDCDKAYAMQLSLEETLLTTQTVYFQVALLYPVHQYYCLKTLHRMFLSQPLNLALMVKVLWYTIRVLQMIAGRPLRA